MQKNIIQKSAELAESNAQLIARVAGLEAEKNAMALELAALKEKASAQETESKQTQELLAVAQSSNEAHEAKMAELMAERDALASQVQTQAAAMALTPQLQQPAGSAPLAGGDAAESHAQPSTWPEAVKAAGGYVEARARFPQLFQTFIEANKNQKPS